MSGLTALQWEYNRVCNELKKTQKELNWYKSRWETIKHFAGTEVNDILVIKFIKDEPTAPEVIE